MQNYLNLKLGAPKRLAILRKANPTNWRKARHSTFKNQCYNNQGFNNKTIPVWYYADDDSAPVRTITACKTKWFCDTYYDETAFGIVGSLSHGRFIAGYELTMNDEQVFFGDIFDSTHDAALMADQHAEYIADQEREHEERFDADQKLESLIEQKITRLDECLALRNESGFEYVRPEITRLIRTIRESRKTLETDYAEYQ